MKSNPTQKTDFEKKIQDVFEEAWKQGNLWGFNFSIGYRNGDVFGGSFEDKNLLEKSQKKIIVEKWAKDNRLDYKSYESAIDDLINRLEEVKE